METDEISARDAEINELKAQNTKFESWFSDIGVRFGKLDEQTFHAAYSDDAFAKFPGGSEGNNFESPECA